LDTKVKLTVLGIANSRTHSGAYALILSESGPRRIPVIVGVSEAQSIAIAIEELKPQRPLTHDLFVNFIRAFQIHLKEIVISKFDDGVFYSEMLFTDGKREIRIDSRTSDAIAIALRMKCEIYTLESIIQKCGVVLDENMSIDKDESLLFKTLNPEDMDDKDKLKEWLGILQNSEIKERMEKAVAEENYEFAKIYKEELLRREREGDEQ